ncbi:MAG: type II toxin-antitoxin system prevent-host-death family antitoxin [Myxococcaceae bacterium]
MHVANIHEAKTHLSQLLEKAIHGEEIWIAKAGKLMVQLVPYDHLKAPRQLGLMKGMIEISEDFDELPQDLLAAFNGDT